MYPMKDCQECTHQSLSILCKFLWFAGGLWPLIGALAWGAPGLIYGVVLAWLGYWSYRQLIFASVSDTSRWQWLKWVLLRVLLSVILGLVFGFAVAEALNANEPITGESEYEDDDDHDIGIMVYSLVIAIVAAAKLVFDMLMIAYLQWVRWRHLKKRL